MRLRAARGSATSVSTTNPLLDMEMTSAATSITRDPSIIEAWGNESGRNGERGQWWGARSAPPPEPVAQVWLEPDMLTSSTPV